MHLVFFSLSFILPVLKNASMSPASFAVSSAPSPELMAATTRTWRSMSPERAVPSSKKNKKSTRKVAQKSLPSRQKRHCGHGDSYGDSHTASGAICGSPSLGEWVEGGKRYWAALIRRGHRVPPREWRVAASGGGRGRPAGSGRTRANLRRLSETRETAGSSGNGGPSLSVCVRMCVKLSEMWGTICER